MPNILNRKRDFAVYSGASSGNSTFVPYDSLMTELYAPSKSRKVVKSGPASKASLIRNPSFIKNGNWRTINNLKPEKKTIDSTNSALTAIAVGGSITSLLTMAQGVAYAQRIGNRIYPVEIVSRMKFIRDPTTPKNSTVRIIVFQWHKPTSTAPTAADILQNASSGTFFITSPLNLFNIKNFSILKDVTQEIDSGHGEEFFYQLYHKCKLQTTYNETVQTPTEGDIFLMVLDFLNTVNNDPIQYTHYTRVRYQDD